MLVTKIIYIWHISLGVWDLIVHFNCNRYVFGHLEIEVSVKANACNKLFFQVYFLSEFLFFLIQSKTRKILNIACYKVDCSL